MRVTKDQLRSLISSKLQFAGLPKDHAETVAEVLAYADSRGQHSHGAIRVEYYAERISKGGTNKNPLFSFEKTGPCTGIYDGDNAAGHVVASNAMKEAISMAKENGVALVGIKRLGHAGSLSYYVRMAADAGLIGISLCQSDPMVMPYGGSEKFYGTNPIAFGFPGKGDDRIVFDMGTSVGVWGKVLQARIKNEPLPEGWAVDQNGDPTINPHDVSGLLPIAGPKGYGLAMAIDILAGILVGLPFGKNVSAMYDDLSTGRNLGQLHIVIDPSRFRLLEAFEKDISETISTLNSMTPAKGFDRVSVPGQLGDKRAEMYEKDGIDIQDDIYNYLISDNLHKNKLHPQ